MTNAAGPIHDTSHCPAFSTQNLVAPASALFNRRFASRERVEPISFVRQAGAAAVLVTLSLSPQSGGMAALIRWGRERFARRMYGLQRLRGAVLRILLWSAFYRWHCFPAWGSSFYFSTAKASKEESEQ
jgi:hypothetical protein